MGLTYRPLSTPNVASQPITALSFDPVSDTLWAGDGLGNILSVHGPHGLRGAYFPVGGDLPVKKILVAEHYVRALGTSGRGVGSWSKGGLNNWFYRSLHTVTTFSNTISASPNFATATNVPELALVNGQTGSIVRQFSAPSLITHLVSSHTLLLSGSADGCLRTHDVRVHKSGDFSESTVRAHVKGVQGLEVSGNLVFTIGWGVSQSRPIPDPVVKVYDLRNFRELRSVTFSPGPGFITALPRKSSSIVITSNTGFVNIVDTANPTDAGEFYQLNTPSYISSVAVSPTGVHLGFGDADGTVHLLTAADKEGSLPLNGFDGNPFEWPDVQDPLPDVPWDDSIPLNSIGMPFYDSMLLSSWSPKFLPDNLSYPPPPKIPPQIENTMRINEFVGYATMPKELQGRRNVVTTGPKKNTARFRSGKARTEPEPETPVSEAVEDIPKPYRNVDIQYSKFGVEDFDFAFYNNTEYSGLESHIVNSYTNCVIQTLHYCLPIRRLAESHILTNCILEHCLLCELGFVQRMLKDARGINCQASNFCKTITVLARNDIQLIDFGKPAQSYCDKIQTFHRFLLDQLNSESNNFPSNPSIISAKYSSPSLAAAPVTQLVGLDTKSTVICKNCGARRQKEVMTHMVDMLYPKLGNNESPVQSDFTSMVQESIIRDITHKATCPSCKQFTTFNSRRAILSKDLPPILTINSVIYEPGNPSHKLWLDNRHETFVKPFIEVRGQVDGVDDAESVLYELRSLIVEIVPSGQKYGHLVSIVKVPESEIRYLDSPWLIFNDFVVTNVSENEALSIPDVWKVPAILYFERVDMRNKLNYSELPHELDLSILNRDINIATNRNNMMVKHELLGLDELPRPGTVVAIDAEFVSMQQEESEYKSDGTKKVLRPARLSLARVSVLRGDGPKIGVPFIDDHIHTSEAIVDYLTEFSGIKYGDLDPHLSKHTLVPLKVAYKKLRLLVDLGCIFIGHGLSKDFRIINLFVPPTRVLDTVDIYFIPSRQRRLSLRFVSWAILKQNIQTGEHDSIEDARCALLLYRAFQEYEGKGIWEEKLEELYKEGKQHNWKPPQVASPSTTPSHNVSPPPVLPQLTVPSPFKVQMNRVPQTLDPNTHMGQFVSNAPRHLQQPGFGFNQSMFQQNWRRGHP